MLYLFWEPPPPSNTPPHVLWLLPGRAEDKIAALLWLVREAIEEGQPTLVFASTRHHVEFLHTLMTREGIDAACVYGAMDQVSYATDCLCLHYCWSSGKMHMLRTTGILSRGHTDLNHGCEQSLRLSCSFLPTQMSSCHGFDNLVHLTPADSTAQADDITVISFAAGSCSAWLCVCTLQQA